MHFRRPWNLRSVILYARCTRSPDPFILRPRIRLSNDRGERGGSGVFVPFYPRSNVSLNPLLDYLTPKRFNISLCRGQTRLFDYARELSSSTRKSFLSRKSGRFAMYRSGEPSESFIRSFIYYLGTIGKWMISFVSPFAVAFDIWKRVYWKCFVNVYYLCRRFGWKGMIGSLKGRRKNIYVGG